MSTRKFLRCAFVLLLLVVLAAPVAWGDEEGIPYEAPEARIQPPIGAMTEHPDWGLADLLLVWLQVALP